MNPSHQVSAEAQKWHDKLSGSANFYPSTDYHFELVTDTIKNWFLKVESYLNFFRPALNVTRDTVEVSLIDSPNIEAWAYPTIDPETNGVSSVVTVSLGIASKTLGLANRAHVARLFGAHDPMVKDVFDNWSINDNSVGILSLGGGHVDIETFNSVHDVMTLTLFHELAHGLELFPQPEASDLCASKAFEACADEGSGFLFVFAVLHEQRLQGRKDINSIVDRLADAAFFLSALIFWTSPTSDSYHHPWTRMRCFIRGACLAIYPDDKNRWQEIAARAWHRNVEYGQAFALFTNEELCFWNNEKQLADDWGHFLNISVPLMREMRKGLNRNSLLSPVTEWMHKGEQ